MSVSRILLTSVCCVLCFCSTDCGTYENMTDLMNHVLSGYNPAVLPLNDQSGVLDVNISLILYNIIELETVKETMTTVMALVLKWTDERIHWDETEYGFKALTLASDLVWTPVISLAQATYFTPAGEPWMTVDFRSDGKAFWEPTQATQISCPMNMRYWPFDEQDCEISFVFAYSGRENIRINISPGGLSTVYFTQNGEWTLKSTDAHISYRYGVREAVFSVTLKRRYLFYVLTLLLPYGTLVLLCSCVFLLPCDSGERVSFSITILLAQTVFLSVISDSIPKLSNPVPLFGVGILSSIIMSSFSSLVVILNSIIHHRSNTIAVGTWYRCLVMTINRNNSEVSSVNDAKDELNLRNKSSSNLSEDRNDHISGQLIRERTDSDAHAPETGSDHVTWKDVSRSVDKVAFVMFLIATILPVCTIFLLVVLNTS